MVRQNNLTVDDLVYPIFVTEEQKLFDQEKSQEDDFEIPAFLRRQKF